MNVHILMILVGNWISIEPAISARFILDAFLLERGGKKNEKTFSFHHFEHIHFGLLLKSVFVAKHLSYFQKQDDLAGAKNQKIERGGYSSKLVLSPCFFI